MTSNRYSIAKLMAIVAIVAVNIAAARAIVAYDVEILAGVALTWLALQIGLLRLISSRGRGRGRVFWAGFILCGLVAMMTYVWAMMFPRVLNITTTGALIETPGSPMYPIWRGYLGFVEKHVLRLPQCNY